jgi:Ca2+-binding EF-hand superfamily protein
VELQRLAKDVSSEQGLPLPADQLDFSYKLFDLNQDGTLTTEELLRALVIDAAVSEDAVDADVFAVFDTCVQQALPMWLAVAASAPDSAPSCRCR